MNFEVRCHVCGISFYRLSNEERNEIEVKTRDQSLSKQWKEERRKRLTASNFGKVIKMRQTTSVRNTVFQLLYGEAKSKALEHGKMYEEVARKKFSDLYGKKVTECGIFIDKEISYLAATPGKLFLCHKRSIYFI